jgi:hypothetical protein
MTGIIIIAASLLVAMAAPAGFLMKWVKQRKEYKFWLRLTDGQEATEL